MGGDPCGAGSMFDGMDWSSTKTAALIASSMMVRQRIDDTGERLKRPPGPCGRPYGHSVIHLPKVWTRQEVFDFFRATPSTDLARLRRNFASAARRFESQSFLLAR